MNSYFNVHGLDFEIESRDPRLNDAHDALRADLTFFRTRSRPSAKKRARAVRLTLIAIPPEGHTVHTQQYDPYRRLGARWHVDGKFVTSVGRSEVTVIHDLLARRITAAIIPDPALLPDPTNPLFYCVTHPLGLSLKMAGLFFLHAGCVARGDDGVLIIGASHAGKSTLSLSAVRSGWSFLSDEQPLLKLERGTVRAFAFPRRMRMDRPNARRFRELAPVLSDSPAARVVFPIDRIWPGAITPRCTPRVIVFPKYDGERGLEVRSLDRADVFARLLQDDHTVHHLEPAALRRAFDRQIELFDCLTSQARCYSLRYGVKHVRSIPNLFGELLDGTR